MQRLPGLTILLFGILLLTSGPVSADRLKLVIWQKERCYEVADGDVLPLSRGPFFLVMPLTPGEHIEMVAGAAPTPSPLEAFGEGKGMAGPYGGTLFLDWEAFHFFYYEPDDPYRRAELWDRKRGLAYFRVSELKQREPTMDLTLVPFKSAPDLDFVLRKDGCSELRWRIHWSSGV